VSEASKLLVLIIIFLVVSQSAHCMGTNALPGVQLPILLMNLPEARRQVGREVIVSLFKSVVFLDVVQIVSPDYDCSFHLHAFYHPRQNASTNADIACEGTFLVNVCAFNCLQTRERVRHLISEQITTHCLLSSTNLCQDTNSTYTHKPH